MLVGARHRYAARADRLCSALRRYAPEVRFRDPEGGFSVWVETDDAGDDIDLLAAADRCPSIASIDGDLLQQFFTDADLALRVRGAQLVCNRALEIAHLGATLLVLSCHPAPGFVVITLSEARLKLLVFEPTPRRDEMSEAALEPEPPVRDLVPDWVVGPSFLRRGEPGPRRLARSRRRIRRQCRCGPSRACVSRPRTRTLRCTTARADRYRFLAPFVGDLLVAIFARVLAARLDSLLAPIGLGRACLG